MTKIINKICDTMTIETKVINKISDIQVAKLKTILPLVHSKGTLCSIFSPQHSQNQW